MNTAPNAEMLTNDELDALDEFSLHWGAPRQRESVRAYGRAVEHALLARLSEQQLVAQWQWRWKDVGGPWSNIDDRSVAHVGRNDASVFEYRPLYAAPVPTPAQAAGREAFEAWMRSKGEQSLPKDEYGYCASHVQLMWRAWQAAGAAQAAQAVPAGWQLVPVEPTIGMLMAGSEARISERHPEHFQAAYAAMLAAAPTPAAQAVPSWQPISEPPAERCLCLVLIGGQVHVAQFDPRMASAQWWNAYGLPSRIAQEPTHWMPLPAAPTPTGAGDDQGGAR